MYRSEAVGGRTVPVVVLKSDRITGERSAGTRRRPRKKSRWEEQKELRLVLLFLFFV
jgi:hypothetical protein